MQVGLVVLLLAAAFSVSYARNIRVYNKCPFTIWPGVLGPGNPANGGFRLNSGESRNVPVADNWTAGRIWARTGCDGNFNCETGFCRNSEQCNGAGGVPPVSLAEFTLGARGTDFYDVSLVDGYNLPVFIETEGNAGGCKRAGGCNTDVNAVCPNSLKVVGRKGNTVGCKSACLAFNTDRDCCRGAFGTPDKCGPTDYSRIFKNACPTAYSYAYDDKTSTFTCASNVNYLVQFC